MLVFRDLVEALVKGQDMIHLAASREDGPEVPCPGCGRRYRLGEKRRLKSCPICGGRLEAGK